jgi:hypothetical protein
VAELIIERNVPPVTPNEPPKSDQSTQALVRKSTETKSKMAAIIEKNLSQVTPKCHRKIG